VVGGREGRSKLWMVGFRMVLKILLGNIVWLSFRWLLEAISI